jgi:pyruvate,water dikinase
MAVATEASADLVALEGAHEEHRFGGKAVQLGASIRAGLPVPPGVGLAAELVDRVAAGDRTASGACLAAFARLGAPVAVRSSAVGEDSAAASFAGQHLTRLGVESEAGVIEAVLAVWASGREPGPLAYRARLGIEGAPRIGVVIQRMVDAECAGVMFTRCPVSGEDVRVIEAAWGLGESVVGGLVDPDRYRVARGGEVIEETIGEKEIAVRPQPGGATAEVAVPEAQRRRACLDQTRLVALDALATRCEQVFVRAGAHDIEWAFAEGQLWLLQRRAVTR